MLIQGCNKDEPPRASTEAVDHSKLCKDGGATLNAATNECVCSTAQRWNGIRCEAAEAAVTTPAAGAASPPATMALETPHDAPSGPPEPPTTAAVSTDESNAKLAAACKRADGDWNEKESFCLCPEGKVLVGARCRTMRGRMTEEICRFAVYKGSWEKKVCECKDGLVFAAERGGCVPPYKGDDGTILRRECENTLNRGRWEAAASRCSCPNGRIWFEEQCQPVHGLSSHDVCESAYYRGKWDDDRKRCKCPDGQVWLDQTCRSPAGITPKVACESEAGGGTWNEGVQRCICPRLGHWDATHRQCVE
jgi:hypothetical protein